MKLKLVGLMAGVMFGFVLSWAHLTDPGVIRDMLLLREPDVFLLMGSAIAIAAVGCRLLRAAGVRAFVSGEVVQWSLQSVQPRHVQGSILFGVGWTAAGTCPGPAAAMIGQGKFGGVIVVLGILAGVLLQPVIRRLSVRQSPIVDRPAALGL